MADRWRMWLAWGKAFLALLIVLGVVWFFARTLQTEELRGANRDRGPGDLVWNAIAGANAWGLGVAGILYLAGLTCWAVFWSLLLHWSGEPLPFLIGLRACYLSHLGKYVPFGKGWALLMRVGMAVEGGIRPGTAAVTCAYETLTTMAAGALLAVLVLAIGNQPLENRLVGALGVLCLAGIPVLPGVFDFLVARVGARFGRPEDSWPRFSVGVLLVGVALAALGWALLGASLAVTLQALEPASAGNLPETWLSCTAQVSIAYVAGFLASTPGGLGVRELVLQQFLAPTLGAGAIVVVVVLRLLWTISELIVAGVVYWCPRRMRRA